MPSLHERFIEAVIEERARLSSRRGFITGGAKLAGGGALALAVAGGAPSGLRLARAQEFTDDIDILNYALTLEQLEAFYREGLEQFDEDAFEEAFAGVNATRTRRATTRPAPRKRTTQTRTPPPRRTMTKRPAHPGRGWKRSATTSSSTSRR